MAEQLPGIVQVPTREAEVERFKAAVRRLRPGADTSDGSQVDADARVFADILVAIWATALTVGDNSVLENARGQALDQWGEREGVDPRRTAVGASGQIIISCASTGTTIYDGDQLTLEGTENVYEHIGTATYQNGDPAPVAGVTTGTGTNIEPGTQLKWVSQRSGCAATALVAELEDGSGLTGGAPPESDDDFLERIQSEKRNKAASGNDADYQKTAEATRRVAVQKAFTYPAILGAATTALAFTIRPGTPGANRIPNNTQRALVESEVVGAMPADDGYLQLAIQYENVGVVFRITWSLESLGWADAGQWPAYFEEDPDTGPGAIVVQSATSASAFVLRTANDVYTGAAQPAPGQRICFYDHARRRFSRKTIQSVTGTGPWTIVCSTQTNSTDTTFTPAVDQRAMPWAPQLDELLSGVYAYNDRLGPGEMVASFYDDGRRQRRSPRSAAPTWSAELTQRGLIGAVSSDLLDDVDPVEGNGVSPSIGTPGALVYLLYINSVAFFPEAA